jgi:hypothetical protein
MARGFRGGPTRARAVTRLIERDGDRCWYCGFTFADGERACTIDHVVPVSQGGTNRIENIRLACFRCNMRRADGPPGAYEHSEFLARRRWQAYKHEMVESGRWLPKRAFCHHSIRWHSQFVWECSDCGQGSSTHGSTPATVPCAPWCELTGVDRQLWWSGPRVAPPDWPPRAAHVGEDHAAAR